MIERNKFLLLLLARVVGKMFVKTPHRHNKTSCASTILCVGMTSFKKTHRVFGMWGEGSNCLRKQYELMVTTNLHSKSVGILFIQLRSFKAVNAFILIAALLVTQQGVFELQFVSLLHHVLLSYMVYDVHLVVQILYGWRLVDHLRWKLKVPWSFTSSLISQLQGDLIQNLKILWAVLHPLLEWFVHVIPCSVS